MKNSFALLGHHQINSMDFIQNVIDKDSTLLNGNTINEYYIKNISLIPNNMPVEGIVTRGIITNTKHEHKGIDIAAKFNSPVYPAQEGLVILSDNLPHLDNTVIIEHPNN